MISKENQEDVIITTQFLLSLKYFLYPYQMWAIWLDIEPLDDLGTELNLI
jgi:hypothetical protein